MLDAFKRRYRCDWLVGEFKKVVVPAKVGTHVRWIPAIL